MPTKQPVITAAERPAKPLFIYDGECNFCKFWILRWQRFTRGRVEYAASQEPQIARRFPEIPPARFDEAVQFVETDGRVYSGPEAVFRSLTYGCWGNWPLWIYQQMPGFAPIAEWIYHFIAKRRTGFSVLTRLLWGREGALPSYRLTSWIFLRFLGVIYLCAFASLGTQIIGLVGKNGILPAADMMTTVRTQADAMHVGLARYHMLPTLCWFGASDGSLRFLCAAGCALSALLIAGIAPAPCLFLLWVVYLSLVSVCREFFGFQWDALLLETGFLAIFFAPLRLLPRWLVKLCVRTKPALPLTPSLSPNGGEGEESSRVILWLLRWLLFRLMFESGVVKLVSGDTTWRNLIALNYHYQTQPLPTWIGWYAHQLPEGVQKFCVVGMFAIELGAPFLIFAPRRLRFIGCWLLMLLQVIILLTGNYCFFNLLTLALCLLLLDDAALRKLVPKSWRRQSREENIPPENAKSSGATMKEITVPATPTIPVRCRRQWPVWVTLPLATIIFLVTGQQILDTWNGDRGKPPWPEGISDWLPPQSINTYGLFAMMTTRRPEIIIEGSNDGKAWKEYGFKYKPGDLKRAPGFVAPHQPRLDWQMWFAALGNYRQNPWFVNFCLRLLQGSPDVLKLMGKNPFPDAPPRYIRARLYEYQFSNYQQRGKEGVWWQRKYEGEYLPAVSLDDFRRKLLKIKGFACLRWNKNCSKMEGFAPIRTGCELPGRTRVTESWIMDKAEGLNFVLSSDYLAATGMVSFLSVLVLVGVFFYLNRYTGRKYFSTWTVGWLFYAAWLSFGPGLDAGPGVVMVKHWCVGISAALLFWGSVQFLKLPSRPMLFALFVGFLMAWSCLGAYVLKNPLEVRAPIFTVIGLASLVTAFSFFRLRKHRDYLGAGLLAFGFTLWGICLGASPFFAADKQMAGAGMLVATVVQLFIAVSMIVLVLEEARAANEMILQQIRAFGWEKEGLEAEMRRSDTDYHGLFDRAGLKEKLRAAYAELKEAREQSLQQERFQALGQMSRGISHDINNALTPIIGYSNLLLHGAGGLSGNALGYVRSIKTAGEKIARSVTCIRDFYRKPETNGALVVVELNEVAGEVANEMRAKAQESVCMGGREVIFDIEYDKGMPQIMGKKNELQEALRELMLNALEAMPEGGRMTVRTGFRLAKEVKLHEAPQDMAIIEVADTGAGMDEDVCRRCMEPFFSTKEQQGAKGLGLARVFGILQRHNGQIEIESEPGQGTLMRLVLPVARDREARATATAAAAQAATMPSLKILCLDDEPSILDVLRLILKGAGHKVETAQDGESGLEKFRVAQLFNDPFDVVMTDLGMPGIDGHQVAKTIKEESAGTPVIMLTGWGSIMEAEGNKPINVDMVLGKPPAVSELASALQMVVEKANAKN